MNDQLIQMLPLSESQSFLTGVYWWGIDVIKFIQGIENPVLTALMKFVAALGTEVFYVPVILIIFWWIDENRGLRFAILIIVSAWINAFFKDLWKQPRPFNLEPSVGLARETSCGAPSGHSQMALTFWVPMAAWLSAKWKEKKHGTKNIPVEELGAPPSRASLFIWTGAIFFVLLIGFTRLYLGVHFPTDLLAGWLLAAIVLSVYFFSYARMEKLLVPAGMRLQSLCAALVAIAANGLYPKDRSLPAIFLGFCFGYIMMKKYFPFFASGEINGKKPGVHIMLLRCLCGFAGMAIVFFGLRLIFPGEGSLFSGVSFWGKYSPFYDLGHFIRYTLLGFWISAGAPRLFQFLGLAAKGKAL